MQLNLKRLQNWQLIIGIPTFLLVAIFAVLLAVRLITGRSLGLRSFVERNTYFITNPLRAILDQRSVVASGEREFRNIVFLHHSTGSNLIVQGQVRELLSREGFAFWDHGYNEQGLRGPDSKRTGYSYNIPDDNTNPGGLVKIFRQNLSSLPINAFSGLLQHDVIAFKSCFAPGNNIRSDAQLEQYKAWYLEMRQVMDQYPDKIFLASTIPPLNPAETNPEEAARARAFATWLTSDEYLAGHPNIFVFDFFTLLAENDPSAADYNMLRADYRTADDSHPNQVANEALGPVFAEFVTSSIEAYTLK